MVKWQLQAEDYRRLVSEQNPWHATSAVPTALAPASERPLARHLWQRLSGDGLHRYQMIFGPRRVGKTTVLYQTVRHLLEHGIKPRRIWWWQLDHPLLLTGSLERHVRTVVDTSDATFEDPLFLMLDEVVYAEDWDKWLKIFYDSRLPVRIAATASATAALQHGHLESGVGRWEEQRLLPYSFSELLDLVKRPCQLPGSLEATLATTLAHLPEGHQADLELRNWREMVLLAGGFPELLVRQLTGNQIPDLEDLILESQKTLRADAVKRTVYMDIPQSYGVGNPAMLERLLYVLAAQITGVLSPTNTSSDLAISQRTFDRYLKYLEQTFLVFTLTNFSGREVSVQRRGRKLYFIDGAVRNAALQRGLAPLDDPIEQGALLENLAASTLHSLALHSGIRLHYWRQGNLEVDMVFDDPRQPLAFEIASSPSHSRKGLAALIERFGRFRGHSYLVAPQCAVVQPSSSPSGIGTLPLDTFLLAVGHQAHQAMMDRLGIRP